ncbi:MAG: tRNA pseudouridine(55) synthase TruB [bacterium]|nr:tRNA pseudouridine(55) synthase TruB [bacterium]
MTPENFDLEKLKTGSILLFDKPLHWSSFKLVKKVKYVTKAARVGHAGTLDPLATGLLIVCTGKCTKMIEKIQNQAKVYTGTITFGNTTPSYDLETAFDADFDYKHLSEKDLKDAAQYFTGDVTQTPPVFSAVKINGTRAYKFARQGIEVEIKQRVISISEFIISGELPHINFQVGCSKGTYIRSLANDFGIHLKSGSHLSALRRTKIGDYDINDAFNIEDFQHLCGF